MKRDTFLAANSSEAPTTQPTLRNAGQAAEHHLAMPAAGINSRINTKFLSERHRPVALRLPPLPTTVKTLELPKRSCPDRAPEKQKHQAPLPPVTPAQASPDLEKWEAPTHAWKQAPALQSTKVDTVPQVTAMWNDEKPLGQSVAVVQKTNEQQVKHQGSTKSSQVAMSPARADSPVGAVPQGEHSRAPVFPGAHEEEGEAALMEIPGTEVGTPHLTPGADSGNAAASPLAKYTQQPVTEARVASTKELEAAEADVDFHMRAEATLPVFLNPLEEQHRRRPCCTEPRVAKERRPTVHLSANYPLERELFHCNRHIQHPHRLQTLIDQVRCRLVSAKDRMGWDRGMSLPLPGESRCAAKLQHTHSLCPACVIAGETGGLD